MTIDTTQEIANLLAGTCLEEREIRRLAIAESDRFAFGIEIDSHDGINAWNLMKSLIQDTKRYPLLTYGWGNDDFFSRFYYREEQKDGKIPDTSPEAIIAALPNADLEGFLKINQQSRVEDLNDSIGYALEGTKNRFGTCPDRAEIDLLIDRGTIRSSIELEKYLFDWELENFPAEDAILAADTQYLEWYEPEDKLTLMLLPTANGWDSLADIHWFGACSSGTPVAMSFLKKWYEQYEAELVCHYGTMLQLKVGKRPRTPATAFELAWEQEALAQCTTILPGVSLRDHARSLLTVNRWFLHERP